MSIEQLASIVANELSFVNMMLAIVTAIFAIGFVLLFYKLEKQGRQIDDIHKALRSIKNNNNNKNNRFNRGV